MSLFLAKTDVYNSRSSLFTSLYLSEVIVSGLKWTITFPPGVKPMFHSFYVNGLWGRCSHWSGCSHLLRLPPHLRLHSTPSTSTRGVKRHRCVSFDLEVHSQQRPGFTRLHPSTQFGGSARSSRPHLVLEILFQARFRKPNLCFMDSLSSLPLSLISTDRSL